MNQDIKDRGTFVVGLLAAALAFAAFKEEFATLSLTIGNTSYSFLHIAEVFFALLALSVYLYALDYLRYNLGKYQNTFPLTYIVPLANIVFSIAILFPLLIFILCILSLIHISWFTTGAVGLLANILTVLATIVTVAVGFFAAKVQTKQNKRLVIDALEIERDLSLQRAFQLFDKGFYNEAIVEVSKALERALSEKLLDTKNLSSKFISMRELLQLAVENKVIDAKRLDSLEQLRLLRNQAAHSAKTFTKEQAQAAIATVKNVLEGTN